MNLVLLPFPADIPLAQAMAVADGAAVTPVKWHHFPDKESLVTLEGAIENQDVAVVASLHPVDQLALPVRFAAATARELGARSVGLVAPYLAYMRQDRRFQPGQAVSARLFAVFLEETFDWLLTVDPHLHRIARLDQLYCIPATVVSATPLISAWIASYMPRAVVIGPDSESAQWVAQVANTAGVPYQILIKERRGDRDVSVSLPDPGQMLGRIPVIVDDIVSSGHTVLETVRQLRSMGLPAPVVITIHPVFAQDAYQALLAEGVTQIVSTDTIAHPSNAISIAPLLMQVIRQRAMTRPASEMAP
ncbi:phosphoribosylpyrophosphate synthetase [Dyella jiangningensis]|nr:phosphoribosylpyrophosphate synthetase [Dyella jiangningensis]AHX13424.1 phosphoribosylpyrophosphate synthetase [Dyella jiangningensis]